MKLTVHSSKNIHPLTGSIRLLIGSLTLALITSVSLIPEAAGEVRGDRRAGSRTEPARDPKSSPRSPDEALKAGLDYLLKQQGEKGGWGQGGGWRQEIGNGGGRVEGGNVEDPPDLGNTCVSLVALLRSGSGPDGGEHRDAARKAFEFICREVEQAEEKSLFVTSVRNTQLQSKIGTYVDTFLAGWALSELKGHAGSEDAEKRRADALNKVVAKIEANQKEDGSFSGNQGWAAVLSQGLASKALNTASRSGAKVSKQALEKDNRNNMAGLDVAGGRFGAAVGGAEPSSAGVSLYREASKLDGLREKNKSNAAPRKAAEKKLADAKVPESEKAEARKDLEQYDRDATAAQVAQSAVAGKLADSRYVAGFGNRGGEEYLSYMNLGEGLREQGGKQWEDWKENMHKSLCEAQNADGSWAGQHCITGRNFCTSTALLTLLVERAPAGTQMSSIQTEAPATKISAKD